MCIFLPIIICILVKNVTSNILLRLYCLINRGGRGGGYKELDEEEIEETRRRRREAEVRLIESNIYYLCLKRHVCLIICFLLSGWWGVVWWIWKSKEKIPCQNTASWSCAWASWFRTCWLGGWRTRYYCISRMLALHNLYYYRATWTCTDSLWASEAPTSTLSPHVP